MWIKTLLFFHDVVKRHNNSSGIHRLQTDNGVIEDSKLIVIIFWIFIEIFMLSLILIVQILVVCRSLLVFISLK